jgi:LacI family transcriptional regulator
MASKRVTMQDIADACGLSRNTVSKVFNKRGSVPQATRDLIIRKAEALGYGVPVDHTPAVHNQAGGCIALLTGKLPREAHFATSFLSPFTDSMSRAGYTLRLFEISREEFEQKELPPFFDREQIAGIVGIELFDTEYLDMVCGLGIPTVMIDGPRHAVSTLMPCDFISWDNIAAEMTVVRRLVELGARRIGFVGDREHCSSFYERWFGCSIGLRDAGLPLDESLCILAPDSDAYADPDWLIRQIRQMPGLPDAFVCANDYLGIHMMSALKKMGLSIPKDIMVTGFDGTAQSALVEPPLTTVSIPGSDIGKIAAKLLLFRVGEPALPYGWTRLKTDPVWRGSIREKE